MTSYTRLKAIGFKSRLVGFELRFYLFKLLNAMPIATILVEDSKKIRDELIPALLELSNAEVIAIAESSEEALSVLQSQGDAWQLAVVDLFLKAGSSGLTVLRGCMERQPTQKMIVLTNYSTSEIRASCLELGADAVFDKSTEIEAFFDCCVSYFPER